MSYCDSEIYETSSVRNVIARKARRGILPGDLIQVTSGFTYVDGGERTGYFRKEKRLVAADGSHVAPQAEYVARNHPRLSAPQRAAIEAIIAEKARLREAAQAEQDAMRADKYALLAARMGSQVQYRGRTYVVVSYDYTLKVYEISSYLLYKFQLKDLETGEIREVSEVCD